MPGLVVGQQREKNNKFDDLINRASPLSVPSGGDSDDSKNKYDSLISEARGLKDTSLKSSMLGATKKNPDNEAQLQALNKKTGIPVDTIDRNLGEIEAKSRFEFIDFDSLKGESPITAKALSDPSFADVAHDDVLNLQGIEWLFSAVPKAFIQGQDQVELGKIGLRQVFGTDTQEDIRRAEELEKSQGVWLGDDGWFSGAAVEATKLLPQLFETTKGSLAGGTAGAITGATGALVLGQLGPQVATPEEVVTVPGAALTGFGLGARLGAVAVAFQQEAGLAFREFSTIKDKSGKTLDPGVARIAALAAGGINAGLEVFALEKLVKAAGGDKIIDSLTRKGMRRLLTRPSVVTAFKELAKRYASGLTTEVATEVAQEAVTILAGEAAKELSEGEFKNITPKEFLEREAEVIKKTAQAMSLLALPGPSLNFTHDISRAKRATANQETIQALGESAKGSKLRERLPERYKQFVSKVRENGEVENIHIPADKFIEYFQGENIDPGDIAKEIPSIAGQMTEAIATGGDIIIPLEDYATHIAPTEHHAGLANNIRFHSGDMTFNEATEFRKTATEQGEKAAEKVAEEAEADKATEEKADLVQGQVKEQLVKAGRAPDVAEQESLVIRSFFKTLARRTGQDPEALYKASGLSIQGDEGLVGSIGEDLAGNIEGEVKSFTQGKQNESQINKDSIKTLQDSITKDLGLENFSLSIDMKSGVLSLNDFQVKGADRKQGVGTRTIERLVEFADTNGVTISLTPDKVEGRGTTSKSRLIKFYKRFGFVENKGKNADFEISNSMFRKPRLDVKFNQTGISVTESIEFKAFFEGSKVVDEGGRPLPVFHGTRADVNDEFIFDYTRIGAQGRSEGAGFYFTPKKSIAEAYSDNIEGVIEAFLSIKNPIEFNQEGFNPELLKKLVQRIAETEAESTNEDIADGYLSNFVDVRFEGIDAAISSAVDSIEQDSALDQISGFVGAGVDIEIVNRATEFITGHDGVVADGFSGEGGQGSAKIYVAFFPEQIKSTSNIGTFDTKDPRIFFQDEIKPPRGSIKFSANREKAVLTLLENADLSTFFHESGHFFLETFQQVAGQTDNQQIKEDWQSIMGWLGVESSDQIGTKQHEQWARGFEAYIFEGKSPSPGMAEAFARFREWMVRVYRTIKNLNVNLTDDVRRVMDRMLATDEEIQTATAFMQVQTLWKSAQEAGVTEKEFENYQSSAKKAADDAHKTLLKKAEKVVTRKLTKTWKDARKKKRIEVEQEVNQRPVYQTLAFFKAAPSAKKVKADILEERLILLGFIRDAVQSGEPGSRIVIEQQFQGQTGETIRIPSTFPEFFQNKGFIKKEVLRIIDNTIEGKGITARQTRILNDLLDGASEEFRVREDISKSSGKLIPAGSLDLEVGDTFEIRGEKFTVKGINDVGDLIIQDGERFEVDPFDMIPEPDEGSIKRGDGAQKEQEQQQDAELPDGLTPAKLARKVLIDIYGKDFLKTLPSGTIQRGSGGLHPDFIADLFGFSSGDEMIQAIKEAEPKKEVIERETDQAMEEEFGDLLSDGSIQEEAISAVLNNKRGNVLANELRILERLSRRDIQIGKRKDKAATREAKSTQKQTKIKTSAVVKTADSRLARRVAKRAISEKKVRNIRPDTYQAAALRAGKRTIQAIASKDYEGAKQAKLEQLISHFMYIEARNAKEDIAKIQKFARSFDKTATRKNIPVEYLEQIDNLLDRFEFRNVSLRKIDSRKSLLAWKTEQESSGNEVIVDEKVLNESFRKSFQDMTLDELRGLKDTIKNIEHLGRLKGKLINSKELRDFDSVVNGIVDSIEKNNKKIPGSQNYSPDLKEKIKRNLSKVHAEHTKMEFLFIKLDGWEELGQTWTELFKPMADAETSEQELMEPIIKGMRDIFGVYSKSERSKWNTNRIFIKRVGMSFTKAEMISVALNWGNDGNRQALMEGFKWDQSDVETVLDQLTEKDWKTVQAIWDLVDTLWPTITQLQKNLTGIVPEKVEAISVNTKFGNFKGGYYPLKFDGDHSYIAFKRDEKAATNDMLETSWLKPNTKHGHTIERVGSAGQRVKLSLGVLTEHLTNVAHDITHRKAILDIDKIIQDARFREAVEQTAGKDMYRQLRPWLQAIAHDRKDPASVWERIIGRARVGATVVNMGWKVTTATVQPLGFLQTIRVLGVKYSMIGLTKYFGSLARSPWEFVSAKNDFVFERSTMMRNRAKTFDRDVRDSLKNNLSTDPNFHQVRQSFFYLTGMMDMAVAVPTWLGAYQKGMDELFKGDEERSIDFADSVLRRSQSSGGVKDLAAIQRGSELRRMFTSFYSYFSVLYNLFSDSIGQVRAGKINMPQFVASMFLLWFVPAVLGELVAGRGPDDDEEYSKWAAKNLLSYPFQAVVGLRDIAQGVIGDFGYGFTPVVDVFESTVKTAKSIAEGEADRQLIKTVLLTTGYWGQLPARQMWITGEAIYDFATGEDIEARDFFLARRRKR